MSAETLLLSRFPVKPGAAQALVKDLHKNGMHQLFTSLDEDEVLTILPLDDGLTVAALRDMLSPEIGAYASYLNGDVRRELLEFVEAPKGSIRALEDSAYVQLRHVEVMPDRMADYRKWRDETIFDVVREHDAAEVFVACHSVISGQPGVMFVAGFSVDPEIYNAAFTSDRYAEIVREAGDSYITGGTDGLYTKFYKRNHAITV